MSRYASFYPEQFDGDEPDPDRPEPETMTEEELSSLADDLSSCPAFIAALHGTDQEAN